MNSDAQVCRKKEGAGRPQKPKADLTKIKKFVNICDYVSRELVSQSVLHTVEEFFNLNLVENANENGLYDFSISMMRPVLILTEPRGAQMCGPTLIRLFL